MDSVFIHHPRLSRRHKAFPEVTVVHLVHRSLLPPVKFTDHRYPRGVGGKGAEYCSIFLNMRPQILIGSKFFPCIKAIIVHPVSSCKN